MALKKSQESLRNWTKQKWTTASGKKSLDTGEAYFPAAAVAALKKTGLYDDAVRQKKAELENNDGVQYRDDLKNRVRNLEALLAASADEKDELRNQVLQLTAEVHALRVKVDFLTKENERLKDKYS